MKHWEMVKWLFMMLGAIIVLPIVLLLTLVTSTLLSCGRDCHLSDVDAVMLNIIKSNHKPGAVNYIRDIFQQQWDYVCFIEPYDEPSVVVKDNLNIDIKKDARLLSIDES